MRAKELCFTTLSLAMETMAMRLSVVKQSFFGPPGQYGCLVTRANYETDQTSLGWFKTYLSVRTQKCSVNGHGLMLLQFPVASLKEVT